MSDQQQWNWNQNPWNWNQFPWGWNQFPWGWNQNPWNWGQFPWIWGQSQWGCNPMHCRTMYTVKAGDSMWSIANMFGVSLDSLIKANPQISNPNLINPGQQICIP